MAFKLLAFAAFVTVARAGILGEAYSSPLEYAAPAVAKVAYSEAPAVSYSSLSSPAGYAIAPAPAIAKVAAPLQLAAAGLSYAAPAQFAAPALSYAAPAHFSAPAPSFASPALSYAHAAPVPAVSYAAPAFAHAPSALSYAAPAVKVAAPVAYAAPIAKAVIAEPSAPAHYDFGYAVSDPLTGDNKSQQESRRGDSVQGSYSLIDADGTKRTVEYTADAHNGFNAVVHKEPAGVAVKAVGKVHAPVAYAQPAVKYSSPLGYASPVSQSYYH